MPDIHLDTDEVDLVIGGDAQRRPCDVVLRTNPHPHLLFRVSGLELVARLRVGLGTGNEVFPPHHQRGSRL